MATSVPGVFSNTGICEWYKREVAHLTVSHLMAHAARRYVMNLQASADFGDPSPESSRVGAEWARGADWGHLQTRSHEVPCCYVKGWGGFYL